MGEGEIQAPSYRTKESREQRLSIGNRVSGIMMVSYSDRRELLM